MPDLAFSLSGKRCCEPLSCGYRFGMIGSQYPSPCLKKLAEFRFGLGVFALLGQRRRNPLPGIQSLWMIWGQGFQLSVEDLAEFSLCLLQLTLLRQHAGDMAAHMKD